MRKVIFLMHVSLDGMVAGPNGEMDWIVYTKALESYVHSLHATTDTAIYGRITYEMMAGYWPGVLDDPEADEGAMNHAVWVDEATKIVISTTMQETSWRNTVIIGENVAEEIRKLKAQPGQDMWLLGSASVAQYFIQHNLIDEYWLNVNPVILGSGKPLFEGLDQKLELNLIGAKTLEGDVVALRYAASNSA